MVVESSLLMFHVHVVAMMLLLIVVAAERKVVGVVVEICRDCYFYSSNAGAVADVYGVVDDTNLSLP